MADEEEDQYYFIASVITSVEELLGEGPFSMLRHCFICFDYFLVNLILRTYRWRRKCRRKLIREFLFILYFIYGQNQKCFVTHSDYRENQESFVIHSVGDTPLGVIRRITAYPVGLHLDFTSYI